MDMPRPLPGDILRTGKIRAVKWFKDVLDRLRPHTDTVILDEDMSFPVRNRNVHMAPAAVILHGVFNQIEKDPVKQVFVVGKP